MKNPAIDIIVVGGGASGMMAAITAAKEGCKVMILEHNDVLGKKILATGNGRCNFTNIEQGAQFYRSESPAFVLPSLDIFDANQTIQFFSDLGVMTTERNGYCYPRTMQASAIRNSLLNELQRLQVKILTDMGIRKICKDDKYFIIETKSGNFTCKKCIIATGGKAEPKSGSDGSGYIYAKQLGHHLTKIVPALVPLISDAGWLKDVKGVRQDAKVTLFINGNKVFSDHGEVQFADYGISGIPAFQISRYAAMALEEGHSVTVSIDFVPETDGNSLKQWILKSTQHYKNDGCIQSTLSGVVNQKIADMLAKNLPFGNSPYSKLSGKQIDALAEQAVRQLKATEVSITGTKTFAQAQVTAGGIQVNDVNAYTMESKLVQGLYFAGEILDVDGMCGGYNLQWAWASGYIAGMNAAK